MDFKTFKDKFQKVEIEEYPHRVSDNPVVSVCIQTYQHISYIKTCLEGVLMQKTNFPIEILLGEDASNDGTRDICVDYAKKFPEKIRLFLHKRENNIKIGSQPTGRFNYLYNLYSARGKYVAFCEGDDYWIDENKLQKQFDVMEKKGFAGCFHDVKVKMESHLLDSHIKRMNPGFDRNKEKINLNDFIKANWLVPFCSFFYKRELFKVEEYLCSFPNGDFPMYFELLMQGDFYKLKDTMAVYLGSNQTSITNNRNVIDRIYYELEKLKLFNNQMAKKEIVENDNRLVFEAMAERINSIQKLTHIVKGSSIIRLYLKLYDKLSFLR